MKRHQTKSMVRISAILAALLLLATTVSVYAIKIKLSNGTTFNGKLASQNDTYVIMEIGGTKVSIAKKMIAGVEGLPPGVTIAYPGSPAPAPAPVQPHPKPEPPPAAAQLNAAAPDTGNTAAQSKPVEVILKNGVKFKGVIVSETENLITLQNENGSKVNIYKNIIAEIPGRQSPVVAPTPVMEEPKIPPPATAPVSTEQEALPGPKQETPSTAAPGVTKETKPIEKTPVPLSTPVPIVTQPVAATPAVPQPPPAIPAVTQPSATVSAPPAPKPVPSAPPPVMPAPPPPPAVAAPVKRSDGRHELLLKNGTAFVGTVVSENDRFFSFSTHEGTTINILKRLVRKFDGVPYVINAAADTSSQFRKSAPASAAGNGTVKTEEPKPMVIKRRSMPVIAIKPGVSMAELMDSLKSAYQDQRAVSARQIGTMGQWANGSISALVVLLADTAGSQEFPPPETDSAATEKLLPPGFEAARALSRIGPEAIDELKRGTRSGNQLMRERSVFGCGEAQDAGLVPTLQQALKDDDPRVRAMAAHGLRFSEAASLLIQALGDIDGDVRTFAAATLGDLRNPGAVKPLVVALKDVKPSVRAQAALSLGRTGAREAVAPIAGLVNDMAPEVREKGAVALGMIKDSTVVPPLLVAITDPSAHVRTAAAEALGALRDPRAIPSLYSAMQEKNDTVRSAVETAIKQLTEIPLLIAALDNENQLVRENTAYILWLMTGTDLGQDKKAWTEWFGEQGKKPVKKMEPEKVEKEKDKDKKEKEEKKKK